MRVPYIFLGLASTTLALAACGRSTFYEPRDGAVLVCDGDVCTTVFPDAGTDAIPDAIGWDVPDAPIPTDGLDAPETDTRVPRCGDSILDPGESCDDGNNTNGDGCSATCRWESRCGDGRLDPSMGEVCDDGNNRSGDGCRSDCRSNERCGNGIVDTAVGEVCDSSPGCAADCRSIVTCGNGRLESGEQCDDGNRNRWDGCAPDCKTEQGIVLDAFFIAADNMRDGCDFSGDRRVDNAFSRALGPAAGIFNTAITNGISNGQLLIQLAFLALDDPLGRSDSDLRVGWLTGADGDMDRANNRDPGTLLRVNAASLNPMGLPQANYQSTIVMSRLDGGPEDITLDLPGPGGMPFVFRVTRSRISGLLQNDGMRISALDQGVLCGAIPALDLARLPNFLAFAGGGGGGGGASRSTFLEALVGSYRVMIPLIGGFTVGPQQPDIDLDGDGLERYEATPGDNRTPPQITACIDGNGTRVTGRMCQFDRRFADGFSSAFRMNGVWFRFAGVGAP